MKKRQNYAIVILTISLFLPYYIPSLINVYQKFALPPRPQQFRHHEAEVTHSRSKEREPGNEVDTRTRLP